MGNAWVLYPHSDPALRTGLTVTPMQILEQETIGHGLVFKNAEF